MTATRKICQREVMPLDCDSHLAESVCNLQTVCSRMSNMFYFERGVSSRQSNTLLSKVADYSLSSSCGRAAWYNRIDIVLHRLDNDLSELHSSAVKSLADSQPFLS